MWPPFFLMHCTILLFTWPYSVLSRRGFSTLMRSHVSLMIVTSSSVWFGPMWLSGPTSSFRMFHRFSIILRSGLCGGQSNTSMLFLVNHSLTTLAVWHGALSCWKIMVGFRSWCGLTAAFRTLWMYLSLFILPSTTTKSSIRVFVMAPHSMTLHLPCLFTSLMYCSSYLQLAGLLTQFIPCAEVSTFTSSENITRDQSKFLCALQKANLRAFATEYQTRGISLPFLHYNLCSNFSNCKLCPSCHFHKNRNHLLEIASELSPYSLHFAWNLLLWLRRLVFKCSKLLFRITFHYFYLNIT